MKDLAIIILGDNYKIKSRENIEIIFANENNLIDKIKMANCKYITFIKENDIIEKNYINIIEKKIQEDFDCCFINYSINYNYINNQKILTSVKELKNNLPYYGEYIWSFIFKKSKLMEILNCSLENFDEMVNNLFKNKTAIGEVLYYHNPNNTKCLNNFCYTDVKTSQYYENMIYVGNGCNGIFNGYVSWIKNIGRCFANRYDITILYDNICSQTLNHFSKYFRCIKKVNNINFVCARLLVTYSTYFYPKNICCIGENYMFIHGNMSDYPNSRRFTDDIYTKYIAVSKVAAQKAKGYFPTDNIEYILNPFKLDNNLLKPHLKLVSAQRNSPEKKPERFKIIAAALNALDIPFTWNIFTDTDVNVNENGLIYRSCVENPLPYIQDSDYFVSVSDTEALGYSVLEALALNTKVIVTPLEAFYELGIKDGENGYFIPFEYFNSDKMDEMIKFIEKIYKNKDKKINYKFNESLFDKYNDLFI